MRLDKRLKRGKRRLERYEEALKSYDRKIDVVNKKRAKKQDGENKDSNVTEETGVSAEQCLLFSAYKGPTSITMGDWTYSLYNNDVLIKRKTSAVKERESNAEKRR
jgi:hypothetical protein